MRWNLVAKELEQIQIKVDLLNVATHSWRRRPSYHRMKAGRANHMVNMIKFPIQRGTRDDRIGHLNRMVNHELVAGFGEVRQQCCSKVD